MTLHNPMIISRIVGGLGNQMFQYAAARRLASKHDAALKLDVSGYEKNAARLFRLHSFNIRAEIASPEETAFFRRFQKKNTKARILNLFQNLKPPVRRVFMKEKHLNFDPAVLELSANVYLQGYWQSEKYFQDAADAIRRDFTFREKPGEPYRRWLEKIESRHSVALHVRRTDYLSEKLCRLYAVCPPDFYTKAARSIADSSGAKLTFFVFSDDIGWAKNNLKLDFPAEFVSRTGTEDFEELVLMSKCRHNIIANSSFSWWGAWLNNNPEKTVIAPHERLKDPKMAPETKNAYPSSWIIL